MPAPNVREVDADLLLRPGYTYASLTDEIAGVVDTRRTPLIWPVVFAVGALLSLVLTVSIAYLLWMGIGIWGNNSPVGWGFDIANFVWWVGIAHAGTLISSMLLVFNQPWRNSINRFAEAMTVFSIACAGLFPLLHTGRPWVAFFLFPYPSTLGMWPQFLSPLMWDVFAINTYMTVSALFWYVGLIPDLATLRDRARNPLARYGFAIAALGWRGSARHWSLYMTAYKLLAGISTALVVSVCGIVSLDFATSVLPGWHVTIFPPYFLFGAVYCGFAMLFVLLIPVRRAYRLEGVITTRHLDLMARVMLVIGFGVAYIYVMEIFGAYYSGNFFERFMFDTRMHGPYGWMYAVLILFNVVIPQALWFRAVRTSPIALFLVSAIVVVGMWFERFVIVVGSLYRDFLPSSWGMYYPTVWDWGMFLGTVGLFLCLMFLFIRVLPMVNLFEVRHLIPTRATSRENAS